MLRKYNPGRVTLIFRRVEVKEEKLHGPSRQGYSSRHRAVLRGEPGDGEDTFGSSDPTNPTYYKKKNTIYNSSLGFMCYASTQPALLPGTAPSSGFFSF